MRKAGHTKGMSPAPRGDLREQIRKAAEADPSATHEEIARRVKCHPSTVAKYVTGRARRRSRPEPEPAAAGGATLRPGPPRLGPRTAAAEPEPVWPPDAATAAAVLDALAAHPSLDVRRAVVDHKDAAPETLARFVTDPHAMIRALVARHPSTPPEALEPLADDTDPQVRALLATNEACPRPLLDRLAGDSHPFVIAALTRHAPIEVLQTIPNDPDGAVRKAITLRERHHRREELLDPDCPPATLAAAAERGQHVELRALAAQHPNVPADVLSRLAKDRSISVKAAAAASPACAADVVVAAAGHRNPRLRAAAAKNPNCPEATLTALAADEDPRVRAAAARNTSSPESCWQTLSGDKDRQVRAAAVHHCPPEMLHHFARDDDPAPMNAWAASLAAARPDCPKALLERLAQSRSLRVRCAVAAHADAVDICQRLAADPEPHVRAVVAGRRSCPPELLVALAEDPEPHVRFQVAANPSCPTDVLQALIENDDYVRDRAARNAQRRTAAEPAAA